MVWGDNKGNKLSDLELVSLLEIILISLFIDSNK